MVLVVLLELPRAAHSMSLLCSSEQLEGGTAARAASTLEGISRVSGRRGLRVESLLYLECARVLESEVERAGASRGGGVRRRLPRPGAGCAGEASHLGGGQGGGGGWRGAARRWNRCGRRWRSLHLWRRGRVPEGGERSWAPGALRWLRHGAVSGGAGRSVPGSVGPPGP